jgi:hypothetical protein
MSARAMMGVFSQAEERGLLGAFMDRVRDKLRATLMEVAAKEVDSAVEAAVADINATVRSSPDFFNRQFVLELMVAKGGKA